MHLITDQERQALLANGREAAAGKEIDPFPVVKIFVPDGNATWLLTELDPANPDMAYGLADLGNGEPELGAIMLSEVAKLRGCVGLPPERDRFFEAKGPISAYAEQAFAAGTINNLKVA